MKKIVQNLDWLDKHSERLWSIELLGDESGVILYDGQEVELFSSLKECKLILKALKKPYYKYIVKQIENQ